LTDEERKQRLNKQKADSKQRKKQKAMISKEGEHVLFTPSAAASSDVVSLANEYVYAASVQKIIQEQKSKEEADKKNKNNGIFYGLMREEQAVIDKDSERVHQASENCIAMLQKKQAEMTV
jgi:hypothetical protein